MPELKPINDEIDALWKTYPQAPHVDPAPWPSTSRPIAGRRTLLDRGDWDQPQRSRRAAHAGGVPSVPGRRAAQSPRLRPLAGRHAFAADGARRREPSLAGDLRHGLVETAEDFGTRAPVPEYRELLDWLAVDFMEHGWSQKHLIRTIVTSATYQQSSQPSPESAGTRPAQRLAGPRPAVPRRCRSGARHRADRFGTDDATSWAARASFRRCRKRAGLQLHLPDYWKPPEGPDRYRRSLYVFRKRSMPDPVMSNFDAPNGDFACARRVRSNTPLAALTGLNEPIFVEAARALALRVLREGGADDDRARGLCLPACARRAADGRRARRDPRIAAIATAAAGRRLAEPARDRHRRPANCPNCRPDTTPQDAAAWTLAARVLLNLDETITKK